MFGHFPLAIRESYDLGNLWISIDFINVYFDFQHTFCVSIAFGSCVARNTFP